MMEHQVMKEAFDRVASTPDGKLVLGSILNICRDGEPSLDINSPTNTAFLEGIRFVGIQLKSVLGTERACQCTMAFETVNERYSEEDEYGSGDNDGTAKPKRSKRNRAARA